MGPAGELRYPSCPTQKLTWAWRSRELGEFQCYDKVRGIISSFIASDSLVVPGLGFLMSFCSSFSLI